MVSLYIILAFHQYVFLCVFFKYIQEYALVESHSDNQCMKGILMLYSVNCLNILCFRLPPEKKI